MRKVIKFQAPFEKIKFSKISPEAMLRQAIILQAIIDASNSSLDNKSVKLSNDARKWIFGRDKNFVRYCEEAGMETDNVIKSTIDVIEYQMKTRKMNEIKLVELKTKPSDINIKEIALAKFCNIEKSNINIDEL
jgi:hypothetical protein